jgi:hypothetical protein
MQSVNISVPGRESGMHSKKNLSHLSVSDHVISVSENYSEQLREKKPLLRSRNGIIFLTGAI